jgi:hypothetical protein
MTKARATAHPTAREEAEEEGGGLSRAGCLAGTQDAPSDHMRTHLRDVFIQYPEGRKPELQPLSWRREDSSSNTTSIDFLLACASRSTSKPTSYVYSFPAKYHQHGAARRRRARRRVAPHACLQAQAREEARSQQETGRRIPIIEGAETPCEGEERPCERDQAQRRDSAREGRRRLSPRAARRRAATVQNTAISTQGAQAIDCWEAACGCRVSRAQEFKATADGVGIGIGIDTTTPRGRSDSSSTIYTNSIKKSCSQTTTEREENQKGCKPTS